MKKKTLFLITLFLGFVSVSAQNYVEEKISFGDMNSWITREIKESAIIGGHLKRVYAVGPTAILKGNNPYVVSKDNPWASSNVMAKVAGITKASVSVYPEKRGEGYAARLDTRLEHVNVFGLIDLSVLATGSLFLGTVAEPISGMKNAEKKLNFGIPFHKKPVAVRFDYKAKIYQDKERIKATGFGKEQKISGKDHPEVTLFLQKRWETPDGRILAKRIGTIVHSVTSSDDWKNNETLFVLYGDITKDKSYQPDKMKLMAQIRYAVNSKGQSVPIEEIEWGSENDIPTHLQLQFSSSHGGAFIGTPGTTFWVDNVRLIYPEKNK